MDAQLERVLELINAEADPTGMRDEFGRRPASDTVMELMDACYLAVVSVVDVASVDDLHRFLAEWAIGRPVELDVICGQRPQVPVITPEEAGD